MIKSSPVKEIDFTPQGEEEISFGKAFLFAAFISIALFAAAVSVVSIL